MKISDLKCPAFLEYGMLTLDDGSIIDLNEVYTALSETLHELRHEYAVNPAPGKKLPACVADADKLLKEFE